MPAIHRLREGQRLSHTSRQRGNAAPDIRRSYDSNSNSIEPAGIIATLAVGRGVGRAVLRPRIAVAVSAFDPAHRYRPVVEHKHRGPQLHSSAVLPIAPAQQV